VLSASYARAGGSLRVRLVDVLTRKAVGESEQTGVGADANEVLAWSEALSCKLLVPAGCTGEAQVDADPTVTLRLDGAALTRGEKRKLPVGVHQLEARAGAKVAQRVMAVTRTQPVVMSVKLASGELRITATGDTIAPPAAVASSAAPARAPRRWAKRTGVVALVLGAAVAATGAYFGVKSKSDLDRAEAAFRGNGGAYRSGDLDALHSGNSSARNANALFIASGALAAAGLLFTVAF
jgi:hypothetical protein